LGTTHFLNKIHVVIRKATLFAYKFQFYDIHMRSRKRNSTAYILLLLLWLAALPFGCTPPVFGQDSSVEISPFYRRPDDLRYTAYDVFGGGSPSFREEVEFWCKNHPGESINRSLPFPAFRNAMCWSVSGRPKFDYVWSAGQIQTPFDYNCSSETRCGENLSALYPHSWLLGELKNVGVVEAFAPYESERLLVRVFENEDDYKLSCNYSFCYGRQADCWIRASARVSAQERAQKSRELVAGVKIGVWFLLGILAASYLCFKKHGWRTATHEFRFR
jgi:hypothetical protein